MSPAVKQIVSVAIVILESALTILTLVPGNQGEKVISTVIVMLKKLVA